MTPAAPARSEPGFGLRHSPADALLVGATVLHGAVLAIALPWLSACGGWGHAAGALLVGCGLWWGANTVSHNHIHNPLFTSRRANDAFSVGLTLLLGIPQSVWRDRHLWHHAGEPAPGPRVRYGRLARVEIGLLATLWLTLACTAPAAAALIYAPGVGLGLLLCRLQGHHEHVGGRHPGGVSYYGRLHNVLWFNDGYHVEHHRAPREHWTRLPSRSTAREDAASGFPPLLRWLDGLRPAALCALERLALRSAWLQRQLIACHARAFEAALPHVGLRRLERIVVIGGGLFPRTAAVLRGLLPDARIEVIDASEANLACARSWLDAHGVGGVTLTHARVAPGDRIDADLLVVPLAFEGDRNALCAVEGGPPVLVHDWIWRRRGVAGVRIALLLGKRLNVVVPP